MALKRSKSEIRKFRKERRGAEDAEIETLEARIEAETPPKGWTPLAEDYDILKKRQTEGQPEEAPAESTSKDGEQGPPKPVVAKMFSELAISKRTLQGLNGYKWNVMTDIQRASLPHSLAGRDVLGAAKTGSGKTLSFVIPIIEKLYRLKWTKGDGLAAIVLSPTRELAMQTFEVLRKAGSRHDAISAGLVIGGKDMKDEQERIGRMNILIATPGRLLQHMDQSPTFNADTLQILVLDEADRILDMGFSREVNAILDNLPPSRQTLLFSATQTASVQQLARLSLQDPEYVSVHEAAKTATPKKLQQSYIECELHQKVDILWSFVKAHLKSKILVFCSSQKEVRFLFEAFRRLRPGVPLSHLHGKMNQQKRMATYYDFSKHDRAVMFATDIAARGLDFKDIAWVIQFDCPENEDTYIHRVGRTARYASEGHAILFAMPSEAAMLEKLEKRKVPLEKMKVNPTKTMSIRNTLQGLLVKEPELKYLAQKCLKSYARAIHLMADKEVFDVSKLDFAEFAKSLGLISAPTIKIQEVKKVDKNSLILKEKMKQMEQQLVELKEAKKAKKLEEKRKNMEKKVASGSEESGEESGEDSDSSDDEGLIMLKKKKQRKTTLQKMLQRKNIDVLSDAYAKMRDGEQAEGEDSDDDLLVLKPKGEHLGEEEEEEDEELPVKPAITKSQHKKMFTKIDVNRPRFGNRIEFNDSSEDEQEPYIQEMVKDVSEKDDSDKAAYKEKLRAKRQKRKERMLKRRTQKKELLSSQGPGAVLLGGVSDEEGSGEYDGSGASVEVSDEGPTRNARRKQPSSGDSAGSGSDSDDDGNSSSRPQKKKRKTHESKEALEEAAKKVLANRLK